jgi:Ulp1 family protease
LEKDSEQQNQLIKGHRITLETFQRLRPGMWFNDEIINYYFQLLQDKDLSAWYLSTFFMDKSVSADGYNYANVRKWSKGQTRSNRHMNLLDLTRMYTPINLSNRQWTLVVVDIRKKKILYLDSLLPSSHGEEYCRRVLKIDDVADKQQILLYSAQWTITIGTTQP